MDSRSLRHQIRIQRLDDAQSESGAPSQEWIDIFSVWANIRYLNGTESIKSDAPISVARASIRIRYRTDIVANMRVLHGATIFNVRAVLPDEERREFVDLVCETGGNDG